MRRIAALVLAALPCAAAAADQPERSAYTNYVLRCAGCHGFGGAGSPEGGIPAFPGSVGHIAATERGRTYMMHVPGVVGSSLTDAEIAGVMNYVIDTWGGAPEGGIARFTGEEVTRRRAEAVPDVVAYRRLVVEELDAMGVTVADYPWP
ncbi:c-type cytochrome [Celeribacter indicus]|uniref:Cytochrome c domain-containing protein n=1 Tax=Celeribacter indicus TaxID=1208324 RepID=A0A0B5DX72_9RHOB|nr:cytochrome c [Celeribacter indicus]AJE48048.1 hypothetical protein P73_3333 [Celeribacter indicus]SDW30617.1 hypothetical protein SAMN05443573_102329 [Celeribacter indicus]